VGVRRDPGFSPDRRRYFFSGKPLQIIVGLGAGGGYDLWARSLARHIADICPAGQPRSCRTCRAPAPSNAANHLYAVAPKDGTVIGIVGRDNGPLAPLRGEKATRFDATKFSWIGSPASETNVCIAYHNRSGEDVFRLAANTRWWSARPVLGPVRSLSTGA